MAQIALSCVLLIGAGLLARTVSVLMHQDHGFDPIGALEAKVVLSDTVLFDGAGGRAFVERLLERVRAIPGVQHAGFGTTCRRGRRRSPCRCDSSGTIATKPGS